MQDMSKRLALELLQKVSNPVRLADLVEFDDDGVSIQQSVSKGSLVMDNRKKLE